MARHKRAGDKIYKKGTKKKRKRKPNDPKKREERKRGEMKYTYYALVTRIGEGIILRLISIEVDWIGLDWNLILGQ